MESTATRVAQLYLRGRLDEFDRAKFYEELEAAGIKSPNKWFVLRVSEMAKKSVFTFRTKAQESMWNEIIHGQITDGKWENGVVISDIYWADIPTSTGGRTAIRGTAPSGARTRFDFADMLRDSYFVDELLEIARRTDPAATVDTVREMLDEISAAVGNVQKEAIRAPTPAPSSGAGPASDIDKIRHELAWKLGVKSPKVIAENVMVGRYGQRTKQYHYFVVWEDPATGEYVGANAYGTFGKSPRSAEIARGTDLARVQGKVESKMRRKSQDYETKPDLTPNQWRWRFAADASRVADRYLVGTGWERELDRQIERLRSSGELDFRRTKWSGKLEQDTPDGGTFTVPFEAYIPWKGVIHLDTSPENDRLVEARIKARVRGDREFVDMTDRQLDDYNLAVPERGKMEGVESRDGANWMVYNNWAPTGLTIDRVKPVGGGDYEVLGTFGIENELDIDLYE